MSWDVEGCVGSIEVGSKDGEHAEDNDEGAANQRTDERAALLFVEVFSAGKSLVAMVDTGAEVNVVGRVLVQHLECVKLDSRKIVLSGCGGSAVSSEWVVIPMYLSNGHFCEVVATVSDAFGSAIILGSPFLHKVRASIDYDAQLLRTTHGAVPCIRVSQLKESNEVAVNVIIPEMSDEDCKALSKLLEDAKITTEQREILKQLLMEYGDLWIGNPRGVTNVLTHSIRVTSKAPIRQRPRRYTPAQQKIIDEEVENMIKSQAIRPSKSQHAQEVVLIMKKTGDWRFCVDFRRVNDVTVRDEHPLPRISDLLRSIRNSKYLVALDLRAGYWQVPVEEESIPLTAFRTRTGLYEFTVMPFGLANAPATFCRLMDMVLGDMYWRGASVYLDDVLVHAEEFEKTIELLREVLGRLREAGLTLAMNKCSFFPRQLLYLGHIVEGGTLRPNPAKVEALHRIQEPRDVRAVRSLLGCIGYFRQYIPNYSAIVEPLNRLLRHRIPFDWTAECENAKVKLIEALERATLTNPLEGDLLKIETDASDTAIGAALYCRATENDPWCPVEFLSRNLDETQRRWPVHEKEGYAIVYSLEKFDPYVRGRRIEVYTDNASLKWMKTSRTGKVARWASRLAEYDMQIIYRPGKTNVCADFLSRYIDNSPDECLPDRATFGVISTTIPSLEAIMAAQYKEVPPRSRGYVTKNGVVYHGNKIWVPPSQRVSLIEGFHNVAFYHHPGVRRTMAMIRKFFSWPGIQVDVAKYVRACLSCQRLRPGLESLQGIVTAHPVQGPFFRVHMDVYETTVDGKHYDCLTMIDNHTKWAEVTVLPDKSAVSIAEAFMREWVCRFGCPAVLIVDHGQAFIGRVMAQLCQILGVKRLATTTCHPDANAPIESFHRVLTKGLQRFVIGSNRRQINMAEVLQLILFGYRLSYHSSIRESPAYLTLGIDPRPPTATWVTRCQPHNQNRIDILNTIREEVIQKAYIRHIQQFQQNQEHRLTAPLQVGELVLLPVDRAEAAFHAIQHRGQKVKPRFTMPYRVIRVFNQGRSAHCVSLCPVSPRAVHVREASIQDLRRVEPPLTPFQLDQWKAILEVHMDGHVLDPAIREELIKRFWEAMENPQYSVEKPAKRRRHDLGGVQ